MRPDNLERLPRRIATPLAARPTVVSLRTPEARCPACGARELCFPAELEREVQALSGGSRRIERREALYHAGEPFNVLYVVRVGTLKTVILAEDGRDQITGYHMSGDIVGLCDLGRGVHTTEAIALEDSEVCSLPFDHLDEFTRRAPSLVPVLFGLMARDLYRNQNLILLLGSMSAEERLACYLLDLSQRHRDRGFSASEFVLRMTREEIASFLGLKLETVSRIFSRLQGEGLLQVQGRAVKLLDTAALRELAGRSCESAPAPGNPLT